MNTFIDRVNAIVQSNQASMAQNVSYPDAGMGALENVANNVPRQADLMNQPHMLAYINPQEEQFLRDMGGAGIPGPDGIPVYGWLSDTWSEITSGGNAVTETYNSGGSSAPATSIRPVARPQSVVDKYANTAVPGSNSGGNTGTVNTGTITPAAEPEVYRWKGRYNEDTVVQPKDPKPVIKDPKTVSANSLYETAANYLTPFDNTEYIGGNLYDTTTNELATNVGTKTYYGTVGQANDPNTGVKTNPDMVNLQTQKDSKGIVRDTYDTVIGSLPSTVAGALVPGSGMFLTAAKALGQYQVGPNPKDVMTGTGKDGQDIYQNADGRYYSKGMLGNYYFVDSATDSTPISESNESSALDDMMAANDKSNNQSAALSGLGGTGTGPNTTAANKLFNRYYKSGSGYGLPPWLAKYASGKSIDQILAKTTINGKDYYETPDGQFINASELDPNLVGAIVSPET